MLVGDFISGNSWDSAALFSQLPLEVALKILRYPLPRHSDMVDRQVFSHNPDGSFTSKSAYTTLQHVENANVLRLDCGDYRRLRGGYIYFGWQEEIDYLLMGYELNGTAVLWVFGVRFYFYTKFLMQIILDLYCGFSSYYFFITYLV